MQIERAAQTSWFFCSHQAGCTKRWRTAAKPRWSWRSAGSCLPTIPWTTIRAQSVTPWSWERWCWTACAQWFSRTKRSSKRPVRRRERQNLIYLNLILVWDWNRMKPEVSLPSLGHLTRLVSSRQATGTWSCTAVNTRTVSTVSCWTRPRVGPTPSRTSSTPKPPSTPRPSSSSRTSRWETSQCKNDGAWSWKRAIQVRDVFNAGKDY